uniref:Uncharacterized protein n=1 Tax=Gasterosteus aculeatus TaxID=69293 RepID=G3P6E5_GASAC
LRVRYRTTPLEKLQQVSVSRKSAESWFTFHLPDTAIRYQSITNHYQAHAGPSGGSRGAFGGLTRGLRGAHAGPSGGSRGAFGGLTRGLRGAHARPSGGSYFTGTEGGNVWFPGHYRDKVNKPKQTKTSELYSPGEPLEQIKHTRGQQTTGT